MQPVHRGKSPITIASLLGWLGMGLLMIQGLLPGLVVCFGGVSHVAVETAYTNVHGTPFQGDGELRQACCLISISHDDYPLVAVATKETAQRLLSVLEPFSPSVSAFVDVLPSGIGPHPTSAANASLASLRTVILRI